MIRVTIHSSKSISMHMINIIKMNVNEVIIIFVNSLIDIIVPHKNEPTCLTSTTDEATMDIEVMHVIGKIKLDVPKRN